MASGLRTLALCVVTMVLSMPGEAVLAQGTAIEPDVTTPAKPWTSLKLNNDPAVFRFALVSDNAGGPRPGIFAEAVAKLNLLQPEFVVTTGDLIEGYQDSAEQLNLQWDRFMGELGKLEMPFFFVAGNHDAGKPLWAEVYRARFGASYYHFVYKDVLFLFLATNDAPDKATGISPEQVAYVQRVLKENAQVRWTLVFQHKPLWNEKNDSGPWHEIAKALEGRKCTIFAGHTHNYLSQPKPGISYITQATTGGGSTLRGAAYGEVDAIAWVTMTADGPRVANLQLEGILDRDYVTPEKARALALFRRNQAVTATSLSVEQGPFQSGVSQVKLVNPAETPLRVKILSESPAGVRIEPSTIAAVIPAHGEQTVDLHITADRPIPVAAFQPIVLHWNAWYDSTTNTPSVELGGELRVVVDEPFGIPRATTAPTIDAHLDEWGELPFVVDQPAEIWHNTPAWKGPQDGSYRFGVRYDDQYLYLAIQTHDDEPCFDGWKYWQDFAIVQVDPRGSASGGAGTAVFSTAVGPKLTAAQAEEYAIGKAPEGIRSAAVATAQGFDAELAIPLVCLNQAQGGDWKQVRLNVAFADFDRRDARDGVTILYWRPNWTHREAPSKAGLFFKEAAETR